MELKCGCKITSKHKFEVGAGCRNCKECNLISKLHPFGNLRLPN